jgi:hypothetical protein
MTRKEILRARGYTPAELARPPIDEHEDEAMPETTTSPCRECRGPLPEGRTAYCGEECHKTADRNRAREAYRRKAAKKAPGQKKEPRPARAEPKLVDLESEVAPESRLNGHASLVAELLALPGVGEVELEFEGHRFTVRPREAV